MFSYQLGPEVFLSDEESRFCTCSLMLYPFLVTISGFQVGLNSDSHEALVSEFSQHQQAPEVILCKLVPQNSKEGLPTSTC